MFIGQSPLLLLVKHHGAPLVCTTYYYGENVAIFNLMALELHA